jgi:HEAT repeat protein
MLFLLLALAGPLPHGGQYQPPAPDHSVTPEVQGIVAQPGLGPELVFEPSRWEWWFDFNQEMLLRLRERLAHSAAAAASTPFHPVSDDLRTAVVLPALVDAVRPEPPTVSGIRRNPNPRDVRSAAVLALGHLNRPEAVPYIELVAENDPDLFVRTQAVLALGFSGSPNAAEALSRLYRNADKDPEVRTYAAAGLGLIGNASPSTCSARA